MEAASSPQRRSTAFHISYEFVSTGRPVYNYFFLHNRQRKQPVLTGRQLRDASYRLALPGNSGGTADSKARGILARPQYILIGQYCFHSEFTSYVGVHGLDKETPAQGPPAVLHRIHNARLPTPPK